MRALTWLILLPVIEIVLLIILIGARIGGSATWLWFFGTFLAGLILCRWTRSAAQIGGAPEARYLWRHAAGFCLMFPGLLTDLVGFMLLVPPLRRWLVERLKGQLLGSGATIHFGRRDRRAGRTGEGAQAAGAGFRRKDLKAPIRDADFEVLSDEELSRP